MHKMLPVDLASVDLRTDRSPPLSSMCREIGLAAVAAELHLRASELELDAAVAVERGAAALFLAGFGPQSTPLGRVGKSRGERKVRRASRKRR
jgi:hypothetical protein